MAEALRRGPGGALRLLALLLAVGALATACGSTTTADGTGPMLAGDLPGWRAVADAPGIADLAPDLSGLTVTGRHERPALVRAGDVIRFAAIGLATPQEAAEVVDRASGDDYAHALESAFRGTVVRREPQGYRLTVPRPAESGADTVEVFVLRRSDEIVLVELISSTGFDPALRNEILALVSR